MNKILYVFDIDGTLTPSRQKIDSEFCAWFNYYFEDKSYCLVTGSDMKKVREQLTEKIISRADVVFACSGNYIYAKGKVLKVNEFHPHPDLIAKLSNYIKNSKWKIKTGNHLEPRNGLLNFSVVGRNCTDEQRKQYYEWDKSNKERKNICRKLAKKFPDLCFEIGGEISIDIYPKGKDKAQILQYISDYTIYFFGDGIEPGRNDWSLAQALTGDSRSFKVKDWQDTKRILTELDN